MTFHGDMYPLCFAPYVTTWSVVHVVRVYDSMLSSVPLACMETSPTPSSRHARRQCGNVMLHQCLWERLRGMVCPQEDSQPSWIGCRQHLYTTGSTRDPPTAYCH
jgi:hypothetical protein